MTNYDFYILDIINKSDKTDFDSGDFPQINPDAMNLAFKNLKVRGLLDFHDFSSDSVYEYVNVSVTSNGLILLKALSC